VLHRIPRSSSCSSGSGPDHEDYFAAYSLNAGGASTGGTAAATTASPSPAHSHCGSSFRLGNAAPARRGSSSSALAVAAAAAAAAGVGGLNSSGVSASGSTSSKALAALKADVSAGLVYRIKFKRTSACFAPALGLRYSGELSVGDCVKVRCVLVRMCSVAAAC
jgi:hypothetical protein